tara:strand:+ start:1119 stop:1859 length:741 start_codon:yes stop_codon:yes gene_type:complete
MINLVTQSPRPLGDAIDTFFLAHIISKVEDTVINLHMFHPELQVFNDLITFGDVELNSSHRYFEGMITGRVDYDNFKNRAFYLLYSKQLRDIPLQKNIEKRDIDLPKRFITVQWDAGQLYRKVDRWSDDRIPNIESYYKNLGYEIVRVGGEGDYKDLRDIIYIMSKASLHVGADSGMMHIAKFLMPINKIHVYINIRERKDDSRFPDSWNVPFMAREIFRRGAKMNFCEYPHDEQIKYFKDVSLWA